MLARLIVFNKSPLCSLHRRIQKCIHHLVFYLPPIKLNTRLDEWAYQSPDSFVTIPSVPKIMDLSNHQMGMLFFTNLICLLCHVGIHHSFEFIREVLRGWNGLLLLKLISTTQCVCALPCCFHLRCVAIAEQPSCSHPSPTSIIMMRNYLSNQ